MLKQIKFFGVPKAEEEIEKKYSSKIEVPIYEPKQKKPSILELVDLTKTTKLIKEINNSSLSNEEKFFLINAAYRHSVFNYEKVADYYAKSNKEIQGLMEKSALVIIDFEQAIELGFVRLCDEIKTQFIKDYEDFEQE